MFSLPYFIQLEFPERAGALHDFLALIRDSASLCYFNYAYTGERVGRALMGFEFESEVERERFTAVLADSGYAYREVKQDALKRIL